MVGQFPIEDVPPAVDRGRHPASAVVDELVMVSAYSYGYGYDALIYNVAWKPADLATVDRHV